MLGLSVLQGEEGELLTAVGHPTETLGKRALLGNVAGRKLRSLLNLLAMLE